MSHYDCKECGQYACIDPDCRKPIGDHSEHTLDMVPTPAGDLVERVARVMMAASRANANPDDLIPAPHGTIGFVQKWRLFEHLARAAIATMPDRAALAASLEATAEAAATHLKTAMELRTQLAISQANVARLRDAAETGWLIELPWTASSGGRICWVAFSDHKLPYFEVIDRNEDYFIRKNKSPLYFTPESSEAIRFARKEDAEAFMRAFDMFLIAPVATEHQWINSARAAIKDTQP